MSCCHAGAFLIAKMKAIFMVHIPSIPKARQRLIEIVKRRSFQRGNEMKLASGEPQHFISI